MSPGSDSSPHPRSVTAEAFSCLWPMTPGLSHTLSLSRALHRKAPSAPEQRFLPLPTDRQQGSASQSHSSFCSERQGQPDHKHELREGQDALWSVWTQSIELRSCRSTLSPFVGEGRAAATYIPRLQPNTWRVPKAVTSQPE